MKKRQLEWLSYVARMATASLKPVSLAGCLNHGRRLRWGDLIRRVLSEISVNGMKQLPPLEVDGGPPIMSA